MKRFFIVSHTHWDREWYLPFQEFRARLVKMVDRLLEIMEKDPEFRFFVLDGQTIVLEDYLEIRPENEDRLRRLIQAGRVLIGPWYVLPDEFLVTGEAIVRNLLRGAAIARAYGGGMPVGYLPDQFGHIAQMPQILWRAGLASAVLWRGVPPEITENEFRWVAPDGSDVFCVYLSQSYSNGVNLPLDPSELEARLERIAAGLAPFDRTGLLLVMNGSDHREPQAGLPAALAVVAARRHDWEIEMSHLPAYVEAAGAARGAGGTPAAPDSVASPPGGAASSSDAIAPPLQVWRGELRSPARAPMLVGVTSTRMGQKMRHFRLANLLERYAEPAATWAWLTGSPYPAGELAQAWKYLLQNEPHDSVCGCSVDQVHREMETRFDWGEQIAGLVARTAREELAGRIDTRVGGNSARGDGAGSGGTTGEGTTYVVFNLGGPGGPAVVEGTVPAATGALEAVTPDGSVLPVQSTDVHETILFQETFTREQLHAMLPMVSGGEIAGFHIQGADYARVAPDTLEVRLLMGQAPASASGRLDADVLRTVVERLRADKSIQRFRVVARRGVSAHVVFVDPDLPMGGWRVYRLRRSDGNTGAETTKAAGNIEPAARLAATPLSLANEFYELTVNPDGSLRLTDRRTGTVYPAINRFVDGGDAGDEYNYCPPAADTVVGSPSGDTAAGSPAIDPTAAPPTAPHQGDPAMRTAVIESGPVRATLEIRLIYRVPASLAGDRRGRDREHLVELSITTRVSVYAGLPRIDFVTTVDNQARDHRLRVHFEAPFAVASSAAETQFGVVERPVVEHGDPAWVEQPIGTKPHQGFVDISDGQVGLAVMSRGLPEYEVLPVAAAAGRPREASPETGGSVIALTLLRAVGWLSRDDLPVRPGHAGPGYPTPDAQCLGTYTFKYAVVPHAGSWLDAGIATASWAYATPPVLMPAHAHSVPPPQASLPPEGSFLKVTPEVVRVSAIKKAEAGDDLIVRIFNDSPAAVSARVETFLPVAAWRRASLLEEALAQDAKAEPQAWDDQTAPAMEGGSPPPIALLLGPWEIATLALTMKLIQ